MISLMINDSFVPPEYFTVTLHSAFKFVPSVVVAVMVVVPRPTPVTRPFWSTVAILSSADSHVTRFVVAFSGATVAVSTKVSSMLISTVCLSRVIDVALTSSPMYSSFQLSTQVHSYWPLLPPPQPPQPPQGSSEAPTWLS